MKLFGSSSDATLAASNALNRSMTFHSVLAGIKAAITMDTLASENFLTQSFVKPHRLKMEPPGALTVTLGNGDIVEMLGRIKLHTRICGYSHYIWYNALTLANGFECVLGLLNECVSQCDRLWQPKMCGAQG